MCEYSHVLTQVNNFNILICRNYSTTGVETVVNEDDTVSCNTNHLTNFAVLMSVTELKVWIIARPLLGFFFVRGCKSWKVDLSHDVWSVINCDSMIWQFGICIHYKMWNFFRLSHCTPLHSPGYGPDYSKSKYTINLLLVRMFTAELG